MKKVVVALQMLIFRAVGLQIRPSGADKCCCTAISDIEYEKELLLHCKCLYSERSDFKSDRAELINAVVQP